MIVPEKERLIMIKISRMYLKKFFYNNKKDLRMPYHIFYRAVRGENVPEPCADDIAALCRRLEEEHL
jgi:hypothetical protein